MSDFGKLAVSLSLNSQGFANGLNRAAQQVNGFRQNITRMGNNLQANESQMTKAASALNALKDVGSKIGFSAPKLAPHLMLVGVLTKQIGAFKESYELSKAAEDVERRRLVLAEMLDKTTFGRGKTAIKEIHATAHKAGEPKLGYEDAARQLSAFGIAGDQIVGTLQMLEKVAFAANVPLGEMAVEYGRVQEKGDLTAKKLQLMGAQGIPLLDALAKSTHKTTDEIAKMADQSEITASMVHNAFMTMTAPGSAMDKAFKDKSNDLDAVAARAEMDRKKFLKNFGDTWRPSIEGMQRTYYETKGSAFRWLDGGWVDTLRNQLPWGMMTRKAEPKSPSAPLRAALPEPSIDEAAGKRWLMLQQERIDVLKSLRSPEQQYEAAVDSLQSKLQSGAITQGTYNRALKQLQEPLQKIKDLADRITIIKPRTFEQLEEAGRAIMDNMQTPLERYQNQVIELKTLLGKGAIDEITFGRAALAAKNDLAAALGGGNSGIAALTRGSQEGFSAIRQHREGGDQQKDVKKLVEQGQREDQRLLELIRLQRNANKMVIAQF